MGLTLVVVGKNSDALARFVTTWAQGVTIASVENVTRKPLSVIGNEYLDGIVNSVMGLVHADTWFGAGALETFCNVAEAGAVCGIVGRDLEGEYRWCNDNPGPVSTLDSCSVFLRRNLGLRFDEKLCTSFHLHAEDLCLQAQLRGIPVVVPSARAGHYGIGGRGEWAAEYVRFRKALCAKWAGVKFATT
jgi:hypothetical protein